MSQIEIIEAFLEESFFKTTDPTTDSTVCRHALLVDTKLSAADLLLLKSKKLPRAFLKFAIPIYLKEPRALELLKNTFLNRLVNIKGHIDGFPEDFFFRLTMEFL